MMAGSPWRAGSCWRSSPTARSARKAYGSRFAPPGFSRRGVATRGGVDLAALRIPDDIVAQYLTLGQDLGAEELLRCDLATGRHRRVKTAERTRLTDDNGHAHPEIVAAALRAIRRRVFNFAAVRKHVAHLAAERDRLEGLWKAAGGGDDAPERDAFIKAKHRHANDAACWESIRQQRPVQAPDMPEGVCAYEPAYRVQPLSGRLSEIGGGLQSCSRAMKQAAVEGVPDVHNNDLKSSQLYGLRQEFRLAGIDTREVDELLAKPKAFFAAQASLSVDTWKTATYALLFHGTLHDSYAQAVNLQRELGLTELPAIAEAIRKAHAAGEVPDPHRAYADVVRLLSPLSARLQQYYKWLVADFWEANKRPGNGWYVVNDCGAPFRLDAYRDERGSLRRHEAVAALAAHRLQGKEAALVHRLTVLGARHGFEVIANEHDGLLSLGAISDAAFAEALAGSNFPEALLERDKPFMDTTCAFTPTTLPTAISSGAAQTATLSPTILRVPFGPTACRTGSPSSPTKCFTPWSAPAMPWKAPRRAGSLKPTPAKARPSGRRGARTTSGTSSSATDQATPPPRELIRPRFSASPRASQSPQLQAKFTDDMGP